MQEFFSSKETESELISKLLSSGFKRDEEWSTPAFKADGVFLEVQEIDGTTHLAITSPHKHGFVMELDRRLSEFKESHPLFKFFSSLEQPCAYGLMGCGPEYGIREYIK